MKAENEEMRKLFEAKASEIHDWKDGMFAQNSIDDTYLNYEVEDAWKLYQAAWSASRKSIPIEAVRHGIEAIEFADSINWKSDKDHSALIALKALLPAEKESGNDNG